MSFKECEEKNEAVKTTPNPQRIKALISSAILRKNFVEEIKLKDNNAPILMCDLYEGILELLHALLEKNGYNIRNHICLGQFLKDKLKKDETFIKFDRYRKLRNDILYYGKLITKEQAEEEIKEMIKLFEEIKKMVH